MCSRQGFGKLKHVNIRFLWIQDAVAKKKVTLKREPRISSGADLGTKHVTKERFEALRKMVDMEAIRDKIGTITCDKNEALELAQADFCLMRVSTRAMIIGSRWMYKPPCRRRLRLGATGTSLCEVLLVSENSTRCETPSVVCVIPELLREQCTRVATDI